MDGFFYEELVVWQKAAEVGRMLGAMLRNMVPSTVHLHLDPSPKTAIDMNTNLCGNCGNVWEMSTFAEALSIAIDTTV